MIKLNDFIDIKTTITALIIFSISLFLMVMFTIWFNPNNKKSQVVQLDVTDREKGICAEIYKEGFKWGYGQFGLQMATMQLTKHSEEEIKDELFKMAKNKLENL